MSFFGVLFFFAGIYTVAGAWSDWSQFKKAKKVQFMYEKLGDTGGKIFYSFLGITLIIFGALIFFNVLK